MTLIQSLMRFQRGIDMDAGTVDRRTPMTQTLVSLERSAGAFSVAVILAALFAPPAVPASDVSREVRSPLELHWSYRPLDCPPIPAVRNVGAVSTPVDRFILARLEEKKL